MLKRIASDVLDDGDIACEIFARLPVESLGRCRCVCKSWRAHLASSQFIKKHVNNASSRLLFLMNPPQSIDYEALKDLKGRGSFANRVLHFPVKFPYYKFLLKRVMVMGSCNGLICVEFEGVGIVIWNPLTGVSRVVPMPPSTLFHPLDFFGFCYDSSTDDYKIIRGRRSCIDETLVHVFTLKNGGSWRSICDFDCDGLKGKGCTGQGCFSNGALHWLVRAAQQPRIISFDVAQGKFVEIAPLPDHDRCVFHGLLVYKGCLCVYDILLGNSGFLSIWLMREFGIKDSWTRVVHLPFQKPPGHWFTPLCILENDEILMHRLILDSSAGFDHIDDSDSSDDPDVLDVPDVLDDSKSMDDQLKWDGPDVFNDAKSVDDQDKWDDSDVSDVPDTLDVPDVVVDTNVLDNQNLSNAKSLLVLINPKISKAVLEVDIGFGAAIYRETIVSPVTGI